MKALLNVMTQLIICCRILISCLTAMLILAFASIASAQDSSEPHTVAIKADNGGWWRRCNQCQKTVNDAYPDTIIIGEKSDAPKSKDEHFEMHHLKDGKVAFKADNGEWVGMCTDCIVNGAKKNFITVHVKADKEDDLPSWAKFEIEKLSDGKVALKADNGKFVGRCSSCSPGAAYPEQVTAHVDDSDETHAQWEIEDIEE
jgi:hypothetical protein